MAYRTIGKLHTAPYNVQAGANSAPSVDISNATDRNRQNRGAKFATLSELQMLVCPTRKETRGEAISFGNGS